MNLSKIFFVPKMPAASRANFPNSPSSPFNPWESWSLSLTTSSTALSGRMRLSLPRGLYNLLTDEFQHLDRNGRLLKQGSSIGPFHAHESKACRLIRELPEIDPLRNEKSSISRVFIEDRHPGR